MGYVPYEVVVGDVDGDGDLDLLTANSNSMVSVRLNDGHGTFFPGSETAVGSGYPLHPLNVAVGDVDGDGDLDVFTPNYGGSYMAHSISTVSVRLNDGKGHFSGGSETEVGAITSGMAVGDVDGDGDCEVV